MKIAIRLLGALIALIVIALAGVVFYLDSLAERAIEEGAGYALGVPTHVGSVRIGLLSGSFRIRGLEVANPPGFESDHLFALRDGRLEVSPASLRQQTVVVPVFALDGVDVVLERNRGRTNASVILENLKRFESGGAKQPETAGGEGKRFVVEELVITDVRARVDVVDPIAKVAELKGVEVVIPEIRVEKIGSENARGVLFSELSSIITKAILASVAKHGTQLPAAVIGELRGGLSGLARVPSRVTGEVVTQVGGQVLEQLPKGARTTGETLGGGAEKVLEGVGGLFGREKQD